MKNFNGKITKKIGGKRTIVGAEGKYLYAGKYGDLSAVDVGLYWEKNGTAGVWASVCVADKSLADLLRRKWSKKQRPETEEDNDYKYRFTYYEDISGPSVKELIASMKTAMDKWPTDI